MIGVGDLRLEDWRKLQKFAELEHFQASEINDEHVKILSKLKLPKLRQVSLAYCSEVSDDGIESLTNLPSIQGFQLIGVGITDRGMRTLARGFPKLTGINVCQCSSLTLDGFMYLTNSRTITSVDLSLDPFSQTQIENIISTVSNVTWWTISDPHHRLDEAPLRRLGESRNIPIQVVDENRYVRGITRGSAN